MGVGLLNIIQSASGPATTARYFQDVLQFIQNLPGTMESVHVDHIKQNVLQYFKTEPVASPVKLHERMIGAYESGGVLYNHDAYMQQIADVSFAQAQAYVAHKYKSPWTLQVLGPQPDILPRLQNVMAQFGNQGMSVRQVVRKRGELKPVFR
jgi:hypothetical protein